MCGIAGLKLLLSVLHESQEPASSVLVPRPLTPTCCTALWSTAPDRRTDRHPSCTPASSHSWRQWLHNSTGWEHRTAEPDSAGQSADGSVSWGLLRQPLGFCHIQNHNINGMVVLHHSPAANSLPVSVQHGQVLLFHSSFESEAMLPSSQL